jgi:hypothetical protein
MTALRELAERWKRHADHGGAVEYLQCCNELLSILDAEGDGGVSDELLKRAAHMLDRAAELGGNPDLRNARHECAAELRAALENFAKSQGSVSDDARDAERYRWLREHFRFANDSLRELWFDAHTMVNQEDAKDLDQAIDDAIKSQGESNV